MVRLQDGGGITAVVSSRPFPHTIDLTYDFFVPTIKVKLSLLVLRMLPIYLLTIRIVAGENVFLVMIQRPSYHGLKVFSGQNSCGTTKQPYIGIRNILEETTY